MADTKKVIINVTDEGSLAKVESGARDVNAQLKNIAKNSEAASKTLGNMKAATIPRSASVAAKQSESTNDMLDYKLTRGITGATGAAGRDFAKQSQGLGGLVHVYATFAANLFAVSAAFTALKNAADTTNMVKGLEQLGAASGRNLVGLSKQVAELTDGAVSFREAMTSVAQTTSAGMSAENLKKLTIGAKNAAAALGLSVPDALSRLSRGISKIEPELLDELGIFVRVDKAVGDYAKSLGKPVAALTDLERRAGFANAVLAQVDEKFGAMATKANPFSKLLASMENLLQVGLELVNKVFSPMANFLAENKWALAITGIAIFTKLIKTAIPSISEWRTQLLQSAISSGAVAKQLNESFVVFRAEEALAPLDKLRDKINDQKNSTLELIKTNKLFGKDSKIFSNLASNAAVSEKDLSSIKAKQTKLLKDISVLEQAPIGKRDEEQLKALKLKNLEYEKLHKNLSEIIRDQATLNSGFEKEINAKKPGYFSEEAARERNRNTSMQKYSSARILSDVGKNTQEMGSINAFKRLWSDINSTKAELTKTIEGANGKMITTTIGPATEKLTLLNKATTLTAGGFRILTSTIATFGASLMGALGWISVIVSLGMAIYSFFEKAADESAKLDASYDELNSTTKTLLDTMTKLNAQSGDKFMSVSSIQARATAVEALSKNITNIVKETEDKKKKMGWMEKGVDTVKSWFNKDTTSKMTEAVSKAVISGIANLDPRKVEDSFADISKIFGRVITSGEDLNNALRLDPGKAAELVSYFDKIAQKSTVIAAKGVEFNESLKTVGKNITDVANSMIPSDPMAKFGISLMDMSTKLKRALDDPEQSLNAMAELSKDPNLFNMFSPEVASRISAVSKEINDLSAKYGKSSQELTKIETNYLELLDKRAEQVKFLSEAKSSKKDQGILDKYKEAISQIDKQLNSLEENREIHVKIVTDITDRRAELQKAFQPAIFDTMVQGAKRVEASIAVGFARAAASMATASAAMLGDTDAGIAARGKAKLQEISVQETLIKTNISLIEASIQNTFALRENSARQIEDVAIRNRELEKLAEEKKKVTSIFGKGNPLKELIAIMGNKASTDNDKLFAQTYLSQAQSITAAKASLSETGAQRTNALRALGAETAQKKLTDRSKDVDAESKTLDLKRKQVEAEKSIAAFLSRELVDRGAELDNQIARNTYEKETLEIQKQIAAVENSGSSEKDKVAAIAEYNRRITKNYNTFVEQQNSRDIDTAKSRIKAWESEYTYRLKSEREIYSQTSDRDAAILSTNEDILKSYEAYGVIRKTTLADERTSLDLLKATKESKDKLFSMESSYLDKQLPIITQISQLGVDRADAQKSGDSERLASIDRQTKALQDQFMLNEQGYASALASEKLLIQNKTDLITKTGELNSITAKYADILEDIGSATVALSVAFGEVGAKIGGVVILLTKMYEKQEKLASQKKNLNPVTDAKKIAEINEDMFKNQLDSTIAIAGASKKLFKEKTAAYKVLDTMEKASSILRIGVALEEWAVKSGLIASEIAKTAAKNALLVTDEEAMAQASIAIAAQAEAGKQAVKAPTVIEEFMAWLGPWGMAAGVAALAAIGISMGGKGSKSSTFTPNASQRQEVQGTAMGWSSSGQKVQTSRGVFGDDEAKSESVVNSLEIIKNNSIDGLSYDNKVVLLLSKINEGINNSAKSLYSISGIRTGSMFNTIEGTKSSGGILGLFASKISTAITDAGIVINGSFTELASDITKSAIKFYEDVVVTKKTWYGKTSSNNQRNIKAIDDPTAEYFKQIFMNATAMFVDIGKGAGLLAEDVIKSLSTVKFTDQSASLRGLKGEELEKELTSIVSSMLDKGAEAIFKQFENFANFGEGMLETVVRVTDTNTKIKQALSNIGISSIADTTGMASYTITEALSTWAGGLDKFLEINKSYADKFLSESEKLAPIQKAVTSEMSKLGLSGVTTRDQFKQLVQALDLTVPSQQALYTRLMAVSEGFYAVTEAADSTSTANNDKRNLEIELMKLTGRTLEATIAERQLELASIDDSLKALQREVYFRTDLVDLQNKLFDTTLTQAEKLKKTREEELAATNDLLKPIVKYTHAMQDVASAKEELTKAYEKESQQISSTISKLTSASQSLKDFRNSLLSGASSTLTPQQKYEQTRNALNTNIAIANSTPTTEAERLAQETAISKISSLSQEFLAASQVWNASSSKYTDDFNYVLGITGSLSDSLDLQASEAQKTLDAMKQQVTSLGYVETALVSTRDAIETLTNAINTANSLKPASDLAQQVLPDFTSIATGIIDAATGTTLDTAIAIASATATATIMEMITPVTQQISDYINVANSVIAATANTPTTPTVSAVDSASSEIYFTEPGVGNGAAIGGKVSGIRMVGELGPELVDFTQPGRVYTAEQTKGMFAANDSSGGTSMAQAIQSLTREVQYLNREVAQLRKEQNQQTGALIASNYDANQRAADTISETVETTATETQWAERSKVKVS